MDVLASDLSASGLTGSERVSIARSAIDVARQQINDGSAGVDPRSIANDHAQSVLRQRSQRVINATGVILHTNLGRAPLSADASAEARDAFASYTNVELDLSTGDRGKRGSESRRLLRLLTGAEDALVVNNNAAAVFLALAALGKGRGVPVSRSELVEIGGSYRLPEVMEASGAHLVEVGTTNRTRVGDFETALQTHDCGLVLRVHKANYEIKGFTEEPSLADLARLTSDSGVPFVYDIGSGLLDEATPWISPRPKWLEGEPGARQAVDAGSDLVTFSGDKLLGGPQAGVIIGRAEVVERLRNHPLSRVLRVDAATDAALAATLRSYAADDGDSIPFWRMASLTYEDLGERANPLAVEVGGSVETGNSMVGAGSAPGALIETPLVRLGDGGRLFENLLANSTPVLARRDRGDLLIDLRTVDPHDDQTLIESIQKCL